MVYIWINLLIEWLAGKGQSNLVDHSQACSKCAKYQMVVGEKPKWLVIEQTWASRFYLPFWRTHSLWTQMDEVRFEEFLESWNDLWRVAFEPNGDVVVTEYDAYDTFKLGLSEFCSEDIETMDKEVISEMFTNQMRTLVGTHIDICRNEQIEFRLPCTQSTSCPSMWLGAHLNKSTTFQTFQHKVTAVHNGESESWESRRPLCDAD